MKKYLIDGCFDGYHYGHVHSLYQAKELCNYLICGTHSDDEIIKFKYQPCFTYEDRYFMLKYCKYIDKLVGPLPYYTSSNILDEYSCSSFCHGYEQLDSNDILIEPLVKLHNDNKLILYNRTRGISSTGLLYRLYQYINNYKIDKNNDYNYLISIINKIKPNNICCKNNIYIYDTWDLFRDIHINYIEDIKKQHPNDNIIVIIKIDDLCIYNKYEICIILCSISIIDNVLFEENIDLTKIQYLEPNLDYSKKEYIQNLISKNINNPKLIKEIYKNNIYKQLYNDFYLSNIYHNILYNQYNQILLYLQNINNNNNNIIVFDIDETCLNNLPYINNFTYSDIYNNCDKNIYNYNTRFIPKIPHIDILFNYIHLHNIKYSFITGRKEMIRDITINNLKLEGLDKYIHLFMCPNDYNDDINKFKDSCHNMIIKENYNIICIIGDQLTDLNIKYQSFLLFNPFYINI